MVYVPFDWRLLRGKVDQIVSQNLLVVLSLCYLKAETEQGFLWNIVIVPYFREELAEQPGGIIRVECNVIKQGFYLHDDLFDLNKQVFAVIVKAAELVNHHGGNGASMPDIPLLYGTACHA